MITKIRTRLLLMCSFLLLFTLALGLFSLYEIGVLNKSYQYIVNTRSEVASRSKTLVVNFEYSALYLRSYLLTGYDDYHKKYEDALTKARSDADALQKLADDEKSRQMVADMVKGLDGYTAYSREVIGIKQTGQLSEVVDYTLNKKGTINGIISTGVDLSAYQEKLMREETAANTEAVKRINRLVIMAVVILMVAGFLLSLFLANLISRPLTQLDHDATVIAGGDLTGDDIAVKTSDEVGHLANSFNHMRKSLRNLVKEVSATAASLSNAVQHLSATAQQTSANAVQSASTVAQMGSAVEQVAESAGQVAAAAKEASDLAESGGQSIDNVVSQIAGLGAVTNEVVKVIGSLDRASGEITRIVDIIRNIAEQTNLLALNAAIEAARAGDQGRGFAVVAEEVRKLAEQSSGATKEIYRLIQEVQGESGRAVTAMSQNQHEFVRVQAIINETGSSFINIIEKVQSLSAQIQDIAAATQQMSASVQNVSAITEEQSASVQEVSALAEELAGMGVAMEEMTRRFKY